MGPDDRGCAISLICGMCSVTGSFFCVGNRVGKLRTTGIKCALSPVSDVCKKDKSEEVKRGSGENGLPPLVILGDKPAENLGEFSRASG